MPAQLILDLGVGLGCKYGDAATGTGCYKSEQEIAKVLEEKFEYETGEIVDFYKYVGRKDTLFSKLEKEIENGRPVYLSLDQKIFSWSYFKNLRKFIVPLQGHAVVLDGYDTTTRQVHLNFGQKETKWNTWYPLETFTTGSYKWAFMRSKAIIGIKPKTPKVTELSPSTPVSAPILVIDRSGSILGQPGAMQQIQSRAGEVVRAIQKNVTQAAVINFSGSDNCVVDADFTNDGRRLTRAIQSPSIVNTGTALYDAIVFAVDAASKKKERAMLIVFTDGGENRSRRAGLKEAIEYCQKKSVPAIVIGFVGTEGRFVGDLRTLAERTGGFYEDNERTNISDILKRFQLYSTAKAEAAPFGLPE
jgi:hypothetical protein